MSESEKKYLIRKAVTDPATQAVSYPGEIEIGHARLLELVESFFYGGNGSWGDDNAHGQSITKSEVESMIAARVTSRQVGNRMEGYRTVHVFNEDVQAIEVDQDDTPTGIDVMNIDVFFADPPSDNESE